MKGNNCGSYNEKVIKKKQDARVLSLSTGLNYLKNMQIHSSNNNDLRKLFLSSIIHNYDKGNYSDALKDLEKYFLIPHSNEDAGLNLIQNTLRTNVADQENLVVDSNDSILFNIFLALLNWKQQNYSIFYQTLQNTVHKINNSESNFIKIHLDENLIKLLRKFITIQKLNDINRSYEKIFEDENMKFMLGESNHTQKLFIIFIMVFFTIFGNPFINKNKNEELNKEEINQLLNKLLSSNICRKRNCKICNRKLINNLIFKTSYHKSLSIHFNPKTSGTNFIQNKKSTNGDMSPLNRELKLTLSEDKKQTSGFKEYLRNVGAFQGSSKGDSEHDESLKQFKNSISKYKISVPLSNKNSTKKFELYTPAYKNKNSLYIEGSQTVSDKFNNNQNQALFKKSIKNNSLILRRKSTINTPKQKENRGNNRLSLVRNSKVRQSSFCKSEIPNAMKNLEKEIFNMDELLAKYGDNMNYIKDELIKIENQEIK